MKASAVASILAFAALEGANASTVGAQSPQCTCCTALSKEPSLAGKVWTPDNELYTHRLSQYYSANAAQAPWCMVVPGSTEEVSTIVKIFNKYQCPFGMRSGAHSAFKGSNGIEDGVTVDFGYMNATVYDPETKLASIQPGSDWGAVFSALIPSGVVTIGGRASVVGVGGFTTGGGYSFHSNTEGFAADNIHNFEVVLGNGSIVNANAEVNADLWKALKGGSGNFGFVTRLDEYTVAQPKMWGGITMYTLDQRDQLYDAYYNFQEKGLSDPASQNIISCIYSGGVTVLASVLSNIEAIPEPAAFSDYLAIEDVISSTLTVGNIAELVPIFTGPTPLGLYANWQNGMVAHTREVMDFINDKQQEYVAKMKAAAPESNFEVLLQFQPFTQTIVDKSIAKGGNVMGLERVVADGPALQWMIALTVDTEENQQIIRPLAEELAATINKYADDNGIQRDWVFVNYGSAIQDPVATYGEENIQFLRDVSDKYDSRKVFQKLRQTGFKIPTA
ncbi:FAD binding domain-containing protein [Plectosphaerella cucumerina]|uniref:FAD binding domain-containing protein n=1 Tax=Plectosphaerella cucumerina TaxID=40658 RepID=A0A8K0X391_9PEZI|nr:FAD binding domain-containing protein [Plectosphaerella cucumerina]